MKKIVILFLIIIVFTTGMTIPTKKANALFGVADVVIDPAHIGTSVSGWVQEWSRFALDKGLEVVLATLQKRLLDRITNQTIEWIQGDGEPRFVTDPGGFLQDAGDAALGDTIQGIGLGELCSSNLRKKVRIQLEQPTFRDQVSCTLSSAFGNVEEGVEQFAEDFRNGSWIAYNEVLKPQNNAWGLRVITQMELAQNQAKKQQEAQQEISSGNGFLSQKICLGWEKKVDPINGDVEGIPLETAESEDYYLKSPDGFKYTGDDQPQDSDWICTNSRVITPGNTIADSVSKSVGSDIDFIVNADDLSTYVSAIADALINRLTKEAVSGLAGVYNPSHGSSPRGETSTRCDSDDLSPELQEACEDYSSTRNNISDSAEEGTEELENQREQAQNKADRSGTISACNDLPDVRGIRDECIEQFKNAPNEADFDTSHVLAVGESHTHTGTVITSPGENLKSYSWTFESCPDGDCPELSNSSGDISGAEAEIEGPTYTPESHGFYELMIEVIDEDNDISTSTLIEDTYGLDIGDPHDLTIGVPHTHDNATVSNVNNQLNSFFWTFESCPGTCPSINNNESGTINETGETVEIPGPTFMPNNRGFLELVLEITDNSGNSIKQRVIEEVQ